jgi:hypothetical protein
VEKKDAKIELIKIFSETKYEYAYIDDKFVANFIKMMWKNIFDTAKHAIKSGRKEIVIDDFIVSSYSGQYPPHERSSVYDQMLPCIRKELENSEIPYIEDCYTINKVARFKINMEDLKKFSNVDRLEILK